MRLTRERLVGAQGIALSLAAGSLQFLEDGSWTKRLHPGWAAACGITAAALAADDIPAPRAAYEGRYGLYRTHLAPVGLAGCDFSLATAALGSRWELENVAVKPFPACHLLHACVDAAIALHQEGLDADEVAAVRASVPMEAIPAVCEPLAAKRRPKTDYEAKFSLPYAVASALARGRLGLAELSPQALSEPRIVRLMDKVEYAPYQNADYPRYYSGEVAVALHDGRRFSHRVAVNRGNPERALANAEVEAKFFDNCARTLEEAAARQIRDLVMDLESVADAAQLERMLSAP
jgi:2-methylcitrate dehydratase PrpD